MNVGPKGDGTIPDLQKERLLDLGEWLRKYGDAIYGTSTWERCCARTENNVEARFTEKCGRLFIIFLSVPRKEKIVIKKLNISGKMRHFLTGKEVWFRNTGEDLEIIVPESLSKKDDKTMIVEVNRKTTSN